ncbi:MAG: hypothetical protein IPH74_04990 [Bacteroidetes bacterium]|nr:hypothetical protein [Bacteroidota bacterium]MBL0286921.1 hypothetical protein [Bacteroidota bacterium]
MSQAKDIFFELITPKMEEFGFQFKKSKAVLKKQRAIYSFPLCFHGMGEEERLI